MNALEKLTILADAAKYDVACTSSGVNRRATKNGYGNAVAAGICHSFAADGRCISLLKVLQSNACSYDCAYCQSRVTNDQPRATFMPEELAELTFQFYRRNYIEGLFLSSAVVKNPDYTCELMARTLLILRETYRFNGYIHVKAIPGADERLIARLGSLADRMSINIELPSSDSLSLLAPQKSKRAILAPMKQIKEGILGNERGIALKTRAPKFVPAGQSTQMIIGATPETDRHILGLSESLYQRFRMKRVFFSAYVPLNGAVRLAAPKIEGNLPAIRQSELPTAPPPLLREHRLYQADWLMRFYGFTASEILTEQRPNFDQLLDPKCQWAIDHLEQFPVEVNTAPQEMLLRVPGIGVKSAWRIIQARRTAKIDFVGLKKLGAVLKRAQYFITCMGRRAPGTDFSTELVLRQMLTERRPLNVDAQQLSLSDLLPSDRDVMQAISGQL